MNPVKIDTAAMPKIEVKPGRRPSRSRWVEGETSRSCGTWRDKLEKRPAPQPLVPQGFLGCAGLRDMRDRIHPLLYLGSKKE